MLILHSVFQAGILPIASFFCLPTWHIVKPICNKNILQMPLEMEWNIAYILRKLNVKEAQSNHFCLCPVLPFFLCVCMSLQANCFPWQLCGECDINSDPIGVRYWDRSLQLRLFVRVWSRLSSCSGEPLGAWEAPKNSMGSALHVGKSSWEGQRGRAEGAEPGG